MPLWKTWAHLSYLQLWVNGRMVLMFSHVRFCLCRNIKLDNFESVLSCVSRRVTSWHWGILSHPLDNDWSLAKWMDMSVNKYPGMLQSCHGLGIELLPFFFFFFCLCQLDASWGWWAGKCYYCCLFCMLELRLVWGVQLLCICHYWKMLGGYGCESGALLVEVIGSGVALGIGVGVGLCLHFLRKQLFLSVILPDPLTLIRAFDTYCVTNL